MPHLIEEYGSNTLPNVQPVLRALHETLAACGHFGTNDIKYETVLQALQGTAGVQVTADVRGMACASYAKVKT